ncbi:MAG: alanine--tRNA ligase [Thermodesulfobacteria bacterium]|nr:alanine--tRNA ligase [Thermodesulfobacteriota bacterium]
MKALKSHEIRKAFLDYFKEKGHEIVPSSSLVPADDPTLLFTNAGMVQFKKVFLGEEKRPYKRAASCQKCVRAGGKHNDLENVGYTARHHTFFEMLGNFSFGDYFKKEAIEFAWEFLVDRLGLPKDKLWVTVFREDDEAAELWPKLTGISPDRVVRLDEEDNFWAMGDTGPCGPCSEILIDQGEEVGCKRPDCKVGCDCDRFLEIWNLVFMQFFRDETGTMSPLPEPCIDTGMGLERIAAVCQGKLNNFDTDIFENIMRLLGELSGKEYGSSPTVDVAMRVIADHSRASAFLIADGVIPSNEGRGYVLRRIIRRAVRYGRVLGLKENFMKKTAFQVVEDMGEVYPELRKNREFIGQVLDHEEERFAQTLGLGLKMLEEHIEELRAKGQDTISGDFIFKLYDTYGLPVDIVQDVAKEEGLSFDKEGFEKMLAQQRERSKKSAKETITEKLPTAYRTLIEEGKATEFQGYDTTESKGKVLALVSGGNEEEKVSEGWKGELVSDKTPFYAESGGQIGDKGEIIAPSGRAKVVDTLKKGDLVVHQIEVTEGQIALGDDITMKVSPDRRLDTARNHTATHLLHAALRQVLGEHVRQSGSLVEPERLRFDFTHFSALTRDEIKRIEQIVNEKVRADLPVETQVLSQEEAISMGAMALFGEKYGEFVRVVTIPDFSMELCGGTHLERTGQIGLFKIVAESSVAAGIRRIEAVTGATAISAIQEMEDELLQIAAQVKAPVKAVSKRIEGLTNKIKELEKELKAARAGQAVKDVAKMVQDAAEVGGAKIVAEVLDGLDAAALRELGDKVRDRLEKGVVILGSSHNGKAMLLVMVTKNLTDKIKAGDIVKEIAKEIKGGGGGRPDMAQAGGKDPSGLGRAIDKGLKSATTTLSS